MTITEIRQLLENPYSQKEWKVFLQTHFTNGKLFGDAHSIQLMDKTISKNCYSLGYYEINEYTKIGIFEIQLHDNIKLTRNRVGLRNLIKSITQQVAGAMVVFVQGDKWRFSYISKRKVRNIETNTIEDKETAPKRYTYLFGKGEKALTAALRFDQLIQKQKNNLFQCLTLNDFEDAFSVEKLSKEFFKQYKDTYEDFVQYLTGKRYTNKGNKYVEVEIHEPNIQLHSLFGNNEKLARDFCKRMMGRVVFLYFIQKKGWLAAPVLSKKNGDGYEVHWAKGDQNYLFNLYNNAHKKDNFYSNELVPLFFDTLNNPESESCHNYNPTNDAGKGLRFPYLNGGLFDDSFDKQYNNLQLPKQLLSTLFETFNNYNFTVYEDAPDEHTVAVDPEMLGHIFENLLEDNKDKGAFYTPKEIVHYMCRESLVEYLINNEELRIREEDEKKAIKRIIAQEELSIDEKAFAEKNAYKIIDALDSVKICDPAIGSGAFPMGLLQEIFNTQIYLQDIKGFTRKQTEADIKKHIIQECIYGVDIDAGAVDIARLRFWLSLVVDEEKPQPLPNLDYKIMRGNSLLGIPQNTVFNISEVEKLEKLKEEYFSIKDPDKKKILKAHINDTNKKILDTANQYSGFQIDFDFKLFFSEIFHGYNSGFDIVIGNPPYVQLQKDGGKLAKLYEKLRYKTFERTGDIYSLFYEKGVELLKDNGILCYITSNKWMRANYGVSTRQFFAEKTYPLLLIDFGNVQVFETATVDTNILFLQKKPKAAKYETKKTFAVRFTKDFDLTNQSINDFISENGYYLSSLNHNSWVVGERDIYNIKEFIEKQGVALEEWKITINYGIKTGLNEAFIIGVETKNKLISEDPQTVNILRPILRGRDFTAWHPVHNNLWLINSHNGVKKQNINRVDVRNNYPAVYKWLLNFKDELLQRNDIGDDWTNLRNCAYIMDFEKPKIMYPDMTKYLPFVYDESDKFYSNNKSYILTGENLKYLTCFLNSKLFKYCFIDYFSELQGGTRELHKVFFDKIPVKKITDFEEIPFAKIVDYLVALKKEDSQEPTDQFMFIYFEQIANALVYELYFKEAFAKESLEVANYVAQLPEIDKKSKEAVILQIRKAYIKAHEQGNPIRNAVEGITTIPQINLINNSVTI